jgi:dTDP-4-amino-4,6-dideoxygalactose transaminase
MSAFRKSDIAKPFPADVLWYGEPNIGSYFDEEEIEAVVKILKASNHWSTGLLSKSEEVAEFESSLAEYCGTEYAIALTNCGAGLDLALRSLDLEPGDEVICPAVNYKAAHMAVIDRGAKVVFCDINPETLNVDPADVEKRLTRRTRAIIPVHLTGLPAPIEDLQRLVEKYPHPEFGPPKIIYDAARAFGAKYKNRMMGTDGWCTVFSFHSQKMITTLGEGGALVTNDKKLSDRVRNMCSYGGEHDWGMNYRMSKLQAVFGRIQLNRLNGLISRRRRIAAARTEKLSDWQEISLPIEPENYYHVYYVYPILVHQELAGAGRDQIMKIMQEESGIICSVTNQTVYSRWPFISKHCGVPELPVSDDIGERLFCPPIHPYLNSEQEDYIVGSIISAIEMLS